MGFLMYYLVPGIVGGLFSIFMDKVAVPYIKIALFSEKMLESLENMVDTITQNSLQRVKEQSPPRIHIWYEQLHELRKASGMVEEHVEWWNICSRYRRSKGIANLISDIEKHLKLVPLIQLDCVISKLLEIQRRLPPPPPPEKKPAPMAPPLPGFIQGSGLDSGIVGWVITCVLLVMFFYIGRLRNFQKKLESFKDLLNKMKPFLRHIGNGINEIQRGNDASNWLNNANNWAVAMKDIIKEGDGINDTWSPIARCRRSKEITKLISEIDAHLNKLSWINLELLFHEIERPPPSQETEGCTSQPPQALQDHGVCPHYNYMPGGVCPHYNYVPRGFCPHYNYVPRGFCPHYNSVGHDTCSTM